MAFVGFITRKEQDTGVHLRAKIVTPSKKNYGYKEFPVRVKADALDDYSCCVIDHNTTKKNLEKNTLDDLRESITGMTQYRGANGTKIEYTIERKEGVAPNSAGDINKYLDAEGKIIARPKFSEDSTANVSGYITVTVTKGEAKVSSKLPITVKGMTAEEVLANRDIYKGNDPKAFLWSLIKGDNEEYDKKGYLKIKSPLMFSNAEDIMNENLANLSVTHLKCVWTIEKDGLGTRMANDTTNFGHEGTPSLYKITPSTGTGSFYSRIGIEGDDKGKLYLPSYTSIIKSGLYSDYRAFPQGASDANAIRDYRFILGRSKETDEYNTDGLLAEDVLIIQAVLSLGAVKLDPIRFECATQSAPLTTQEFSSEFLDKIVFIHLQQELNSEANKFTYTPGTAITEKGIQVPTNPATNSRAKAVTISVPGMDYFANLTQEEYDLLAIKQGMIKNILEFTSEPKVYACPDDQSANFETVSAGYERAKQLFCTESGADGPESGFTQFSKFAYDNPGPTNPGSSEENKDYMRVAKILIGRISGDVPSTDDTGLCLADFVLATPSIMNRKKFVVKFSYRIGNMGGGATITKTVAQPFIFRRIT